MSNNYTQEQINSLGITKLKDLVRDEKLKIKYANKFKSDTKADLAEQVITKLMIQGRIISDEDEQKYDDEGEAVNPEEPEKEKEQKKESREDRIVKLMEEEEIQADNSLDKYIPEDRDSGKQTLMRKDLPSATTMAGFMDAVKTGMPNISTGDLEKAKNAYKTVKKAYDQNEGNFGKTMSQLAMDSVPELKTLQAISEHIPYFGIGSEEEYQDLKKRMSGQPTALGGGSEAFFKSVGQLLLNPASTVRLVADGVEYLAEETFDLFTKNKTYEAEKAARALDTGGNEARFLSQQRIEQSKKTKQKEKRIADAKGIEYKPDTTSTTAVKKPTMDDYKEATGPDTWIFNTKKYNEETIKYEKDKRRILRTKDKELNATDFRLRDDLAQYVDSILEAHKTSSKSGKASMSDEELEDLIDISESLRDKNVGITYRNLAQIKGDLDSNVDKSILDSENVKIKRGAFDYLEDTMLKGQGSNEADLRVEEDKDYQKTIKNNAARDEQIKEQKIDDFNREVIESRTEHTSNGYVNTDNHDRPELKARIVYGNTDEQLYKTQEEVRFAKEFTDEMSMYPQLDTQDMKLSNVLFQREAENKRRRFSKTFAVPNPKNTGYNINCKRSYNEKRGYKTHYYDSLNKIPDSFIKFSERELIPVFSYDSAKRDYLRDPIRAQFPFTQVQPNETFTLNQKEAQKQTNIFPEKALINYNQPVLRIGKKYNPWVNQIYTH